jgi:glyoxylate utilization-related uncharacterized protein
MEKTVFLDTNSLPRIRTPQGEFTDILNERLAGAKNVAAQLRWLRSGQKFDAVAGEKHQLIYLMEGEGSITLENQTHEAAKGMGVYLGPSETATLQASPGGSLKIFHLVVPRIPA